MTNWVAGGGPVRILYPSLRQVPCRFVRHYRWAPVSRRAQPRPSPSWGLWPPAYNKVRGRHLNRGVAKEQLDRTHDAIAPIDRSRLTGPAPSYFRFACLEIHLRRCLRQGVFGGVEARTFPRPRRQMQRDRSQTSDEREGKAPVRPFRAPSGALPAKSGRMLWSIRSCTGAVEFEQLADALRRTMRCHSRECPRPRLAIGILALKLKRPSAYRIVAPLGISQSLNIGEARATE